MTLLYQTDKLPILMYLYIPIATVLLANLIFFIMTAVHIYRIKQNTARFFPDNAKTYRKQ